MRFVRLMCRIILWPRGILLLSSLAWDMARGCETCSSMRLQGSVARPDHMITQHIQSQSLITWPVETHITLLWLRLVVSSTPAELVTFYGVTRSFSTIVNLKCSANIGYLLKNKQQNIVTPSPEALPLHRIQLVLIICWLVSNHKVNFIQFYDGFYRYGYYLSFLGPYWRD